MALSDAQADATPADYATALIQRLAGRDPIELMHAHAGLLRELVAGVPGDVLTRPEAPGKWSVLDVLVHLLDSEGVYG
jgi:hypothetical protein